MDTLIQKKCACDREKDADTAWKFPLAISYVPMQKAKWDEVYDVCEALTRGTVFPELDLPFLCGGGKHEKMQ